MKVEKAGIAGTVVREFLSAAECAELIELGEASGFRAAGVRTSGGQVAMPSVRNNSRTVCEAPAWVALLWERLSGLPLSELAGQRACGLPKELRFYRYEPGERFKMHKDGPWRERGLTSQVTALLYLNAGFTGGDTVFRDAVVTPESGMLLLFPHATWHEGAVVETGVKYVLRSDILYS